MLSYSYIPNWVLKACSTHTLFLGQKGKVKPSSHGVRLATACLCEKEGDITTRSRCTYAADQVSTTHCMVVKCIPTCPYASTVAL